MHLEAHLEALPLFGDEHGGVTLRPDRLHLGDLVTCLVPQRD